MLLKSTNVALTIGSLRADVKNSNRKHRNDKLNRAIQNFLYGALQVLTSAIVYELHRREREYVQVIVRAQSNYAAYSEAQQAKPPAKRCRDCGLQNDNEGAAKRALAVLTELYRRNVWRDARTVNVIGAHDSATICTRRLACPTGTHHCISSRYACNCSTWRILRVGHSCI